MMKSTDQYKIRVLEKAFEILELFDEKGKTLSITQISDSLNFNKPSTFRILKNLENAGYLEREQEHSKFRLGPKLYYLGHLAEPHGKIRRIARPFLEKLHGSCNETVHLAVLNGEDALYLDKIEGTKTIRVISQIGAKLPAHCSGVGKVLLAGLSSERLERVVRARGLPRFTRNTITDLEKLKAELEVVKKRGYAVDNEEIEEGLKCVAAPLRDINGEVLAAISISVPAERFGRDRTKFLAGVRKIAEEISAVLCDQKTAREHSL
jgi:DNA-binding IclR family transcriptional regulator